MVASGFRPAPEDIAKSNNLPCVLPNDGGDSFGFVAMSRPDCSAGFNKHQGKNGLHPEQGYRSD
jgi:hypothetical protein